MKKQTFNELKAKTQKELNQKIADLEKEIINESLELKMGKVKNVHNVKNKKKDIAKIKTLIKMINLASSNNKKNNVKQGKSNESN
ncbi:50S ribosomal protein L29 [Candidatus Curtissbacteria bacterium RBG_13_35_7]|uniref:Large ribosomal subunit protein uL29 n=1 Tax=Candidatus Curtissbacteria bacterium RBG_13_35_7 TaxID=1797705 RepID=A0A1F5G0T3_9BACT|nr:MAG: 50S ribosomal protein L29 [Candidatus Curtissbacteria bacterium RBG_13_35_7]